MEKQTKKQTQNKQTNKQTKTYKMNNFDFINIILNGECLMVSAALAKIQL